MKGEDILDWTIYITVAIIDIAIAIIIMAIALFFAFLLLSLPVHSLFLHNHHENTPFQTCSYEFLNRSQEDIS